MFCCQHHHCACPRYWCAHCCRSTYTQHMHYVWAPRPEPIRESHASRRDRLTIKALAGQKGMQHV